MEIRSTFLVLFYIFKLYSGFTEAKNYLKLEYKWSQIEFDFPSEKDRQESINSGNFNVGKVQPIDVQVYYPGPKNETIVFITCPRGADGIPATFGKVTNKRRKGNPIIAPYPSWEWQTKPEMCKKQRIVSVFRVFIDECHRLWILDNGIVGQTQVCRPQLLAFDVKTDTLLRQYEIPFDSHFNSTLYITPVVESDSKNCENTFVYNTDGYGHSLLVYDFKNNKSWRIFDKTFSTDPKYENYNIDGISFTAKDGILGLALSPHGAKRKLFYHSMCSDKENWVYIKNLKNESLFSNGTGASQIFHTYPKGRKTQSVAEAMDKCGNLYFGLCSDIKIVSWNIKYPYNPSYFCIIGDNKETMQFPSGIKVISDGNGEEFLWIFTTAIQRSESNNLFPNQTNFRIFSAKVKDLPSGCC